MLVMVAVMKKATEERIINVLGITFRYVMYEIV